MSKTTLTILILLEIIGLVIAGCKGSDPNADNHSATSCTVKAMTGGVVVQCTDGTSQKIYSGKDGLPGPIGSPGPTGPSGSPGTEIYSVQFCPGYTTTYPNSFAEIGLCISDKIYAVYFDNAGHAFLTYTPPGVYNSTSPDFCTFTILDHCQVTQ